MLEINGFAGTDALGKLLAAHLPEHTVVALNGTLGAGKTRLVQAIAAELGIDPRDVTSPTFVLCQIHRGKKQLHHYDVYRVRDDDEFLELGPEESFEQADLTIIEWAERVARCLPRDAWRIDLEVTGPTARRATITIPLEGHHQAAVQQMVASLTGGERQSLSIIAAETDQAD
jgi:tRNA threonylcarbamoyladenosine biosynthesis protein TsaE